MAALSYIIDEHVTHRTCDGHLLDGNLPTKYVGYIFEELSVLCRLAIICYIIQIINDTIKIFLKYKNKINIRA